MKRLFEHLVESHPEHVFSHLSVFSKKRSVIGTCIVDGVPCHIKIATSAIETQRLQKSTEFNRQIALLNPPFQVAQVILGGFFKGNYYKVERTIQGKSFGVLESGIERLQTENPRMLFPEIAQALLWIQKQQIELPNVAERKNTKGLIGTAWMAEKMKSWIGNEIPHSTSLIEIVESKPGLTTALAHFDVTPINTIILPDMKIGLIDADLAGMKATKYYDVCEMHNRLYTRVCEPELALAFIQQVIRLLTPIEKAEFIDYFLAISAFRAVGNYYELRSMGVFPKQEKRAHFARLFVEYIVGGEIKKIM